MPTLKRFIGIFSHRMVSTRLPSQEYAKAVVDYMKGGKPMDKFERFKVLARQIHPQTGKREMIAEAYNQSAVKKTPGLDQVSRGDGSDHSWALRRGVRPA